jgi:O-antigen ligase
MWKAASEMFFSNPLFGVGPGDYKPTLAALVSAGRFPDFILRYNQPHNMYLFALATTGLVGFSGLLFMFNRILRHAGKLIYNKERFFGFLALAVSVHFMTAGLTESLLNIHVMISTLSLLLGVSVRRAYKKE